MTAGPLAPHRDFDVLVVGELNPDLVLAVAGAPAFGQVETIVESATLALGSSNALFASASARLGLRTAFVGLVGDDPLGRFSLEALAARGVDVSGCRVDRSAPTGISVILARPEPLTGAPDRAILTALGTMDRLRAEDVDRGLLRRARHLHVGSFYLQRDLRAGLAGLFAEARAAGLTTSLDPNWDPEERWDGELGAALAETDLFLPNAEELRRIARADDVETAARVVASGVRAVAVKLGEAGGLAVRGTELVRVAPPPVWVVDTVGAGDAFDAGFVHGWLAGGPLAESLRLAVACGALSTTAAGGVDGQPDLATAMAAVGPEVARR